MSLLSSYANSGAGAGPAFAAQPVKGDAKARVEQAAMARLGVPAAGPSLRWGRYQQPSTAP